MNQIGKIICARRIEKNWNQEELCKGICAVSYLSKIEKVAVYRWNRLYPSDLRLDLETLLRGRHMISRREFPGSSHERITEEVYQF